MSHKFKKILKYRDGQTPIKIGNGAYGNVYSPPLKCRGELKNKYSTDAYVSKVVEEITARNEMEIAVKIKEIISGHKKYFCLPEDICEMEDDFEEINPLEDRNYLILMHNCGMSLEEILKYKNVPWYVYGGILDQFPKVINAVNLLHKNYIYHQDIHTGNILFNLDNDELYIIDFNGAIILDIDAENDITIINKIIKYRVADLFGLYKVLYYTIVVIFHKFNMCDIVGLEEWLQDKVSDSPPSREFVVRLTEKISDISKLLTENFPFQ